MSGIRWADSDSDSEEEYVPASEHSPHQATKTFTSLKEEMDHRPPPAPLPALPPRFHGGDKGRGGGRGGRHFDSHGHSHDHKHDRGVFAGRGRGRGERGGGRGGRGGRHERPKDWKQLAKESSILSGEAAATGQVDGSAWMAQRRAKMEQEEKERREHEKVLQEHAFQEKRERRKSQLSALKEAVSKLKEDPPSPPKTASSLQRAAILGEPLPVSPPLPKRPVHILSRDKSQDSQEKSQSRKNEGRWPRINQNSEKPRNDDFHGGGSSNKPAQAAEKQMYDLTISAPPADTKSSSLPRGELQADGTVRFTTSSSELSAENKTGKSTRSGDAVEESHGLATAAEDEGDDTTSHATADEEESSVEGSKASKRKRRNNRRSNRGRGSQSRRNDSVAKQHDPSDEASVGGNISRGRGRGNRGGGRGRGGGRDSSRGGDARSQRGGRGRDDHYHGGAGRGRGVEGGRDQKDNEGGGRHHDENAKGRGRGDGGRSRGHGGRRGRGGRKAQGSPQHNYEIGKG